MRPDELNQTRDEVLFARIDVLIALHSVASAAEPDAGVPLAPYMTFKLLYRAHERIVTLIRRGECRLAKQKLLARTVLDLTGIAAPPDVRDVEMIGNRLDTYLQRKYCAEDKALCRKRNKVKAATERAELERCCICIDAA
eukprot:3775966-Prymnesium_polylepis.1